jgi:flagellar biosynthetic protein FliR
MTTGYLFTWLMVFLRGLGIALFVPQLAGHSPPVLVRIALAACLATLLTGVVAVAPMPAGLWPLVYSAGGEVLLGLAFGFVAQMTFFAVEFAGHIISSEVGLSMSPGMAGPGGASDPMSLFLSSFALILFFATNAHLAVLSAFARSFALAPPGHPLIGAGAGEIMIGASSHLIEIGVRIAAPFIAMNFLVNLAFSVIGRAVPRMSVFVMSGPVRALAGMGLLSGAGALLARYLFVEFGNLPTMLLRLMAAH